MSVAFKVAGSGRMHMATHPVGAGSGSPASIPAILEITGYWPKYQTMYYKLGGKAERLEHVGRKQLKAYIVAKRMEGEISIHDERKLWK